MNNRTLQPKTRKGQATKTKMIEAAAQLMHANGVHSTTVNDVLAKSKTGKSQFSHYFGSKETLVREVVEFHYEKLVEARLKILSEIHEVEDFRILFDEITRCHDISLKTFKAGCPLGQIALEEKGDNLELLENVKRCFVVVEEAIAQCLERLVASQKLNSQCPIKKLARFFIVITQGASVLGKLKQNSEPMTEGLEQFLTFLNSYRVNPIQ